MTSPRRPGHDRQRWLDSMPAPRLDPPRWFKIGMVAALVTGALLLAGTAWFLIWTVQTVSHR